MNYAKIYDYLYNRGYQNSKNIGMQEINHILSNYDFRSILDVGCAQGLAVKAYQERGKVAYGIDVSASAIELAKKNGIENCTVGSATNLPYQDNQFDAVVTTDVLEHLTNDDVKRAVSEICRVASRYVFARVSKSREGDKRWIHQLHKEGIYSEQEIPDLHLTVKPYNVWAALFVQVGMRYIGREGKKHKLLVFEKGRHR